MNEVTGDIWNYHHDQSWVVVPTNIGWKKHTSENVMGAGVAEQAAQRYPELPYLYGKWCRDRRTRTPVLTAPHLRLILFPVKPLRVAEPWLSWQQPAALGLVMQSILELGKLDYTDDCPVYLPLVGCGNGKLNPGIVVPMLRAVLDDRFTLVHYPA